MADSRTQLAHEPSEAAGPPPSAQILRFQPRARVSERSPASLTRPASEPAEIASDLLDELARFEQEPEEEDESINYPRRMLMNVIALAVVAVLMGLGIWLADSIANMEREQDCVLQGRQNCAPIEVPPPLQQ